MVRDDAVATIAQRLGNRTDLNNRILNELRLAQNVLEGREPRPWFLQKLVKVTAEPDDDMVSLTSDFLIEAEEGGIVPIVDGERKTELWKGDYEELAAAYPGTCDIPKAYAIVSSRLVFFPKFTETFQYMFLYYGRANQLAQNVENVWLREAPELMVSLTASRMAGLHLQSPRLAEKFERIAAEEWDKLVRQTESRKLVNQVLHHGAD